MNAPQTTDLSTSLEQSRSGLRDGHRRSLMGAMFLVTASALLVFATLQIFNDNLWLALIEYSASAFLFWGRKKIKGTPHLHRWIYGYLVSIFFFTLVIMIVPNASATAYVWVLMIPVLGYLLLGRREGLRLSLPFVIGGCVLYGIQLGKVDDVVAMIDVLNMSLCAVLILCFVHIYETRREQAEIKLFETAQTDSLTGLANRANFYSVLNRTLAESSRSGSGFALVIMDVDHFKEVNDSLGHEAGDYALSHIGHLLKENLRMTDFVGRLGGEEFGLILRDVKPDDSFELVEKLRLQIAQKEAHYREVAIQLTASFGIAHYPEHADSADALFRLADRCLYSGKQSGRNTVARAGVAMAN